MTNVFIAGGVSYNLMIYVDQFFEPRPQTVFSQSFHEAVGATGAGKALNFGKLGFDVTFYDFVGDDDYGDRVRAIFARENIRFLHGIDPKGTARHVNLMDGSGGRISIHITTPTFEPTLDLGMLEPLIANSDVVILNIINYCRHLLPLAKRHNKVIWCDIHDYDGVSDYHRDFIEAADCLTMSSDEMPDYRPFMEQQIAQGKQLVVCTHGKDGASALTADGQWIETPIAPGYTLVDSNGAGDAFFAGLVYGHLQRYAIEKCLQLGTITAGLCITASELAAPDLSPAKLEAEFQRLYG